MPLAYFFGAMDAKGYCGRVGFSMITKADGVGVAIMNFNSFSGRLGVEASSGSVGKST